MSRTDDLAYRILHLERQLDSYQKLHAEELAEMRASLQELKAELLSSSYLECDEAKQHLSKGDDEGQVGNRVII